MLLTACNDNTSSNSSTESSVIGDESGSTVTTIDGAVIRVTPDGTPDVVEDPTDSADVAENSDGGFTVTTDGATVVTSPDGDIINQAREDF